MRATFYVCLVVLLSVGGLYTAIVPPRPIAAQSGETGADVVAAVNAYRVSQGKAALPVDGTLMVAAQVQADWMATIHRGSHRGPGDSMPGDRALAAGFVGGRSVSENVAGGTLGFMTAAMVVEHIWTPSMGHRLTMLADATHIGAGVASDSENTYFALLIGDARGGGIGALDATMVASQGGAPETPPGTPAPTAYYVAPIIRATPDEQGTITHKVGVGQTAWAIAAIYGVDLETMLQINGLQRPVYLHPGDEIIVKLGPNATPPPRAPTSHTVQDGESAWTIAAHYGITLDALLEANGLERPAILQPGDVLTIPPPQPATTPTPET